MTDKPDEFFLSEMDEKDSTIKKEWWCTTCGMTSNVQHKTENGIAIVKCCDCGCTLEIGGF